MNENKRSCAAEASRTEVLVAKLARFYSVMGHRPEEPGALALMAEMLTQTATDDQINGALSRCARECRFPVRMPDILQRIPGQEVPQLEAEARKAWDVVTQFVKKFVSNDVHGNYGPEYGWYPKTFPKLSDRILDTVRRTGNWRTYRLMTEEDFPYMQKRFFEEYQAWTAVELIESDRLLTAPVQLKQLAETHAIETCAARSSKENSRTAALASSKDSHAPLTEAEIRDRREMLRQQAASFRRRDTSTQPAQSCTVPQQIREQVSVDT